ncbi:MAG: NAD(P)/FAD-dependent oxidoreductase [Myxococcota bacterium]
MFGEQRTPVVAIVGAGFGGIAAAYTLRRAGISSLTIFEASPRIGGTWWDNRYPGCEVDVASHMYSFPFKPHDWSRTHASRAELHAYLEETVEEYGLGPFLKLGVSVDRAVWDESLHRWKLTLGNGETFVCHVLISAVGFLNVPRYPAWPGLDRFEGPKFHTARWEDEHDLTNRTVAVVGTGSSATQIVPAIAPIAKRVHLFQRSPGWVLPKGDRDYTAEERRQSRNRLRHRLRRAKGFWDIERSSWRGAFWKPGTRVNAHGKAAALGYIDRVFADRPDLKALVTPAYPYPGKRPIFSSNYYESLLLPNVELIPHAVARVTPHGLVDDAGTERKIDVLVMATGFQPTNYLARIEVVGRGGRTLKEYWNDEPRGFMGVTVPGFPNFFMLYGPGTNGGEIVTSLLAQSSHALRSIRRMMREGSTAVEVKPFWADVWHAWLQDGMRGTAWVDSENYFKNAAGRIVTQWPYGAQTYRLLSRLLSRPSETTRKLGSNRSDDA